MTSEQLERLNDLLAQATDFIKATPEAVMSTRQKDWLLVIANRCDDVAQAYARLS